MSSKTTTLKTIHNPRNQKTSKRFPNAKNVTRLDFLREAKRTKSLNKRKKSRKKKTYDQKKASSLKKEIQCRDISETTHNPQNYLFLNIPHCYLEEYAFHHGHPGYGIKWFHENEFRKVIKRCERKHIYINGIEAISENGQQFCMIEYCYKWLNIFPRVKPKNRDCGGLQIEQCQERRYQPAIYDTLKTIDYEINWFRFAFEEFVEEAMNRNIKIERYSATCSF